MNKTINFEISEISLIQELSDSQNAIAEVKICHDGMNTHKLPISLDTLKQASSTLPNKWLVGGWGKNDFKGHEGRDQRIIGFFPKENDFKYVEENGKTYLVAKAIVSKLYAPWAFEVFEKDNFRECSMEIQVLETEKKEDGFEWINKFIFNAVTILGKGIRAACPGSGVEIMQFSEDELVQIREKVSSEFSEPKKVIAIKNNKDSAVMSGIWTKPSAVFLHRLLDASNAKSLLNEAYLIVDKDDEPSINEVHYPHHSIKNNALIVNERGIQSAFSRARQQGVAKGEILAHIKKHYKELDLNMDNFSEFGLSQEEFSFLYPAEEKEKEDDQMDFAKTPEVFAKMKEFCGGIKFSKDDAEMCKFTLVDYCDKFMYCYDIEEKKMSAIPYEYAEDTINAKIDEKKKVKTKVNYEAIEEEGNDSDEDDFSIMMSLFTTDANLEPLALVVRSENETEGDREVTEDARKELEVMSVKMAELEMINKELTEFKTNVLEQENKIKIEFTLNEVSNTIPQEKINEWRERILDFASTEIWANALKADAFNYVKELKNKEGFIRMGLPDSIEPKPKSKSKGLWED